MLLRALVAPRVTATSPVENGAHGHGNVHTQPHHEVTSPTTSSANGHHPGNLSNYFTYFYKILF